MVTLIIVYFSVTVPLDIAGVWTEGDRRDRELGHHLVQHLKTVTNQVSLLLIGQEVKQISIEPRISKFVRTYMHILRNQVSANKYQFI